MEHEAKYSIGRVSFSVTAKAPGGLVDGFAHGERLCGDISDFCRHHLPALLRASLDSIDRGGPLPDERYLRLDRLSLDLGGVRRGEWRQRLAERLPGAIAEQVSLKALAAAPVETSPETRLADILAYYLRHGVFPWNGGDVPPDEWRKFFARFLDLPGPVRARVDNALRGEAEAKRRLAAMRAGLGSEQHAAGPDATDTNSRGLFPEGEIFSAGRKESSVHIHNAGLVLAAPFLRHLLQNLKLLDERGIIKPDAGPKAALALELLADSRKEHHVEGTLVLNKILCGLAPDEPLEPWPVVDESEREETDKLLAAMIEHWPALGKIRLEALSGNFLRRPGILSLTGPLTLRVERRPHDLLLNTLPWSFSIIMTPWMRKPMQVFWNE